MIFCWPSNPTPFIVLGVLSLSALPELPVISPLTLAVDDRLIPAIKLLSNPATAELALILNASAVIIATGLSLVVNMITGLAFPKVLSSVVDLALVIPNPATASAPINTH